MNIVSEYETKKEAFDHQCELQKEYGLITDRERITNPHTAESKIKISLTSKGRWTGKTHKTESILKMKEARKKYWEMKKQNIN